MTCEEDDAIEEILNKIETLSGIFQGYQKLIYKGKTLNKKESAAQAKLEEGAKIMLMATSRHTETKVSLNHAAADISSNFAQERAFWP